MLLKGRSIVRPVDPSPRVLLRKLWAKMSESDWRTVCKALYLFHCILKELPIEDHAVLKIFLAKVRGFVLVYRAG